MTGLVREVADGPVIVAIDRGKVTHPDLGLGERRSEFPTRATWLAARRAPRANAEGLDRAAQRVRDTGRGLR